VSKKTVAHPERETLRRALTEALDASASIGEPHLHTLLYALREAVEAGGRDIVGSDDASRVRTWAKKIIARAGREHGPEADLPLRHSRILVRIGSAVAFVWGDDRFELSGVVRMLLELPWEDHDAGDCARGAFGLFFQAGLAPTDIPSWELENRVVHEVTEGAWRRRGPTRKGNVCAVLRGLGFSPKKADDLVRNAQKSAVP
jgi:hypothetical protein